MTRPSRSSPPPPEPGKIRRVVRRKKHIPKISELYEESSRLGMTVKEYVDYLNAMHMDRSKRRNNSSTYDLGPIPYRNSKKEKPE
jgi:hypothetical protein